MTARPLSASFASAALLALCAGCWTFSETPYPDALTPKAPEGSAVAVAVTGFDAALTEIAVVHSWQTVYVPGGGRHRPFGRYEMVPAVTYVPQTRPTDAYLRRAKDEFETAGFAVGAPAPGWTVDVSFAGPLAATGGDLARTLAWQVGTLFFCDYATAAWTARLRVRDNRTGRLVFHRDYEQRYETNAFGLVPLFGISSCPGTSASYIQTWCLSALTDRAVADAAAFLAGR